MKNRYETRGDVTVIFLNSPKYGPKETLISTSKLEIVDSFPNTWYASYNTKTKSFYAFGWMRDESKKRKICSLHRWVLYLPTNVEIDHIDHDTLNNTDGNLRKLKTSENQQNRKGPSANSSSGIRGVHWHKHSGTWNVQLRLNNKKMSFGYFHDKRQAEKIAKEMRNKYMPYSIEK